MAGTAMRECHASDERRDECLRSICECLLCAYASCRERARHHAVMICLMPAITVADTPLMLLRQSAATRHTCYMLLPR